MAQNPLLRKLKEWEYWPFHWVYGPLYIIFAWYIVRSGFRFFFSASNPTIYSGGFLMESKQKVYELIPQEWYPKTVYARPGITADSLLQLAEQAGIGFPLVLKPDIGGRGRAVVIVKNKAELAYYTPMYTLPFMAQAFVPYTQEAGIFFVKEPGKAAGKVTGVVGKTFGTVTGDGLSTIAQLIAADDRMRRYADSLAPQLGSRMQEIPAPNETVLLVPFGNHARGAAFYNWQHRIDDRLHSWANHVADRIEGYYYGRLDVRFANWEDMLEGRHFSIIELNGAGSEPTHMYDPAQSLWQAWGIILQHWKMLWKVSRENHRRGVPYMSFAEGRRMFRETDAYDAELDILHKKLLHTPGRQSA